MIAPRKADIERQFLLVQRRLSVQNLLNEWTTPIRSAVFAVPPGCAPDGWLAQQMRVLLTLAATSGSALLAPAGPALAHTTLASSTPAEGNTLAEAPAQIRLTFTDRLSSLVTVVVSDAGRRRFEATRHAVTGATATVRFAGPLTNGSYTVAYRVVSNDGHTVQGAYGFRVAAPAPATTAATTTTPTTTVAHPPARQPPRPSPSPPPAPPRPTGMMAAPAGSSP